jgi:hypothetical protein
MLTEKQEDMPTICTAETTEISGPFLSSRASVNISFNTYQNMQQAHHTDFNVITKQWNPYSSSDKSIPVISTHTVTVWIFFFIG